MAQIAAEADTSVETVYKAFGGKSGLVRALWERGLDGRGAVPAPERSDLMSSTETDPVRVLRGWGQLHHRGRARRGSDHAARPRGCRHRPGHGGAVRRGRSPAPRPDACTTPAVSSNADGCGPGVSLAQATDILWTYSSAELYDLLVLKSGWPVKRYGEFVGSALIAALLPHAKSTDEPE